MKTKLIKLMLLGVCCFAGQYMYAQKTLSIDSVFTVQIKIGCNGCNYGYPTSNTLTVPGNKIWKLEKVTQAFLAGTSSADLELNSTIIRVSDLVNSQTPLWVGKSDQLKFLMVGSAIVHINVSIIQFTLQ